MSVCVYARLHVFYRPQQFFHVSLATLEGVTARRARSRHVFSPLLGGVPWGTRNPYFVILGRCLKTGIVMLLLHWGILISPHHGDPEKALVRSTAPSQLVVSARSIIAMNVLIPTLAGITLFVKQYMSDTH